MVVLTADEIRLVEQKCFAKYSTEAELMLKAGTACFNEMVKKYNIKNKTVSVLCGNGKNAGDGFVIARLLLNYGAVAQIVICDKLPTIAEPLTYYNNAISSGVKSVNYSPDCLNVDFVVDTMFGIGFNGEPRPPFNTIFSDLKSTNAIVISVDTPSGTNATTGEVCKNCVSANFTIAISTLKYCHILPPANAYCGDVTTVNIGIPNDCYASNYTQTITKDFVKQTLPPRDKNSNKGTFGHQLNICGSYNMFGAGVIATKSAIRTGVGLVKLTLPKSAYPLCASHLVQPIFNPVAENSDGTVCSESIPSIANDLKWANSVVIGCGLGCNSGTQKVVDYVLKNSKSPIVLDADGINSIISHISILEEVKVPIVLTPHPGEMSRLVSKTVSEVQANRINIAKNFAKQNNAVLVLKGANTIVTDGDSVFVNVTGNSSMAMGGTGDMLSGIIGSFIAQGISPFNSAKCAVYIHGLCGDLCASELSQRGITVLDMIDRLSTLMSEFE